MCVIPIHICHHLQISACIVWPFLSSSNIFMIRNARYRICVKWTFVISNNCNRCNSVLYQLANQKKQMLSTEVRHGKIRIEKSYELLFSAN